MGGSQPETEGLITTLFSRQRERARWIAACSPGKPLSHWTWTGLRTLSAFLLLTVPARAQHEHHQPPPATGWAWSAESTVFLTFNFQDRKFRDFNQVDSQNWFMGVGARRLGVGAVTLHGMLSLEPFTLRDLGSSQVFQTGETFGGAPLIDYQHPHDLFMGLSAAYERPVGRATWQLRGGLVDEPALGPTAFMHRASAKIQPTAPLSHHQLDATHITPGVITSGVRAGAFVFEASAFHGREPDEDRLDLDLGPLDSYSGRVRWGHGDTHAQVSAGRLEDPHVTEPGDITRITASIEHAGSLNGRALALTLAYGQNRHAASNEDAFLGEMTLGLWRGGSGYLRGEIVDKHIIGAGGAHPPGFTHAHRLSRIGSFTIGATQDILRRRQQALAVGGDISTYRVPLELAESYGRPLSTHIYLRWTLGP